MADSSDPHVYLALLYEARAAAAMGKSYTLRGKTYTRQSLADLNREIARTEAQANGRAGTSVVIGRHARRV